MKVRVTYTIDVSDYTREAIRNHYADTGLATRKEVQEWLKDHGIESLLDFTPYDHFNDDEENNP